MMKYINVQREWNRKQRDRMIKLNKLDNKVG